MSVFFILEFHLPKFVVVFLNFIILHILFYLFLITIICLFIFIIRFLWTIDIFNISMITVFLCFLIEIISLIICILIWCRWILILKSITCCSLPSIVWNSLIFSRILTTIITHFFILNLLSTILNIESKFILIFSKSICIWAKLIAFRCIKWIGSMSHWFSFTNNIFCKVVTYTTFIKTRISILRFHCFQWITINTAVNNILKYR